MPMSLFRPVGLSFLGALSLLNSGCADRGTVSVEGKVTFNSEPVINAGVGFIPSQAQGRMAFGTTGKDGTFQLTTFRTHDGALPGEYIVTIQMASVKAQGDIDSEAIEAMDPDAYKKAMRVGPYKLTQAEAETLTAKAKESVESIIPLSYGDPKQSPFRRQVSADGKNFFDFSLTSEGK